MKAMSNAVHPTAVRRGERWLFIAPGQFSGKCGIVDYTLCLAREAIRSGCEVTVMTMRPIPEADIADYLERFGAEELQYLRFIRLEADLRRALRELAEEIGRWDPAWISVQFFPPMFWRGRWVLPSMLALASVLKGRNVTVMVHETWLSMARPTGLRGRLLSWLRKREIVRGLRSWRSRWVFCSNPEHGDQLAKEKISARLLPVFSNIAVYPRPGGFLSMAAVIAKLEPGCALPENALTAVFFGRIRLLSSTAMLRALQAQAEKLGRHLFVVWIGEPGPWDLGWQNIAAEVGATGCVRLGRRSAAEISWVLQSADFGVSTTSAGLWAKSGSCAAMAAHGLRIIFPDETEPAGALPPRYAWVRHGQLKLGGAGEGTEPHSAGATWRAMSAAINLPLPAKPDKIPA